VRIECAGFRGLGRYDVYFFSSVGFIVGSDI